MKIGESKPEMLRNITLFLKTLLETKINIENYKPNRDFMQLREISAGYFVETEEMKDFVDYLFDVEEIGDYNEL